jgi:hypothetical protein
VVSQHAEHKRKPDIPYRTPCPADPALAAACMCTRKMSLRVYFLSLAMFLTGGFFAFVAPLLIG